MASGAEEQTRLQGVIRQLRPSELPLFRDHLMRLDRESRRDRFNGFTSDAFIEDYAARSFQQGATVVGYVENGSVRGAAELHERPEIAPPTAEIALSVEKGLQHRGLGGRLFQRLIAHARALGYTRLHVTTHPNNEAMRALARRYNARLSFVAGEAVGLIEVDPGMLNERELAANPTYTGPRAAMARKSRPGGAAMTFSQWRVIGP